LFVIIRVWIPSRVQFPAELCSQNFIITFDRVNTWEWIDGGSIKETQFYCHKVEDQVVVFHQRRLLMIRELLRFSIC
jgi:hypothetical protein